MRVVLAFLAFAAAQREGTADQGRQSLQQSRQLQQQPDQLKQDPQSKALAARAHLNQNQPHEGSPKTGHLSGARECKRNIHDYCKEVDPSSDVGMIECLQDAGEDESETLDAECEQALWAWKLNFTQGERFHTAAAQFCPTQLAAHTECQEQAHYPVKGHMLSCLLDLKANMTVASPCHKFLSRIERIAFSDFRLVGGFLVHCREDVRRHRCGSLAPPGLNSGDPSESGAAQLPIVHSQGSTLQCLLGKLVEAKAEAELAPQCRREVLRVAELQSDDFHLDRPLFFACRADREKLCPTVQLGEGRVFQCLLNAKTHPDMSRQCAERLITRSQVIALDYKASYALSRGCEGDIRRHRCYTPGANEPEQHLLLAYVVLCLQNVARQSGLGDQARPQVSPLTPQCASQVLEHRRLLLSDYRMSPQVVVYCDDDVKTHCAQLESGGKKLHCLMDVEMSRKGQNDGLHPNCRGAIEMLIKAADPGSDYRVDVVLHEACRELIDQDCRREVGSEPDVLSCLMNKLDSPRMSDDCEHRLLEVQYFLSRDFGLDPQLYSACYGNAKTLCSAKEEWWRPPTEQKFPDPGPAVLACLYQHAYQEDGGGLGPKCTTEVQRVLRERAGNVRLLPDVEEACRIALSTHCSQSTQPEEEFKCLQEKMKEHGFKYEFSECAEKMGTFTEMESKDVRLNRALTRSCSPVISTYCADLMDEEMDHGDVMECLLEHKTATEMNAKCKAFVVHFQLVSLRDNQFSYKFKKACSHDIVQHCKDHGSDKAAIVRCLSTIVFEHRVLKDGAALDDKCKHQLRVDYLETKKLGAEEYDYFWKICKKDIKALQLYQDGASVEEVGECLKRNKAKLKEAECHRLIFSQELVEAADNTFDHPLMTKCRTEMDNFCRGVPREAVMGCLQDHVEDVGMSSGCAAVVTEREVQRAGDIRLQPEMLDACRDEVKTICPKQDEVLNQRGSNIEETQGQITYCLRSALVTADPSRKGHVSFKCQLELKKLIHKGQLDPRADPNFYKACETEITKHCGRNIFSSGSHGHRLECMKRAYFKSLMTSKACESEMGRRTAEALADIRLDPVLHEACADDIGRFCNDTPPGCGRIVQCLVSASTTPEVQLEAQCHSKLEEREQLWMAAHKHTMMAIPVSLGELSQLALTSPVRNSLGTIIFLVAFVSFVAGLCCARATKCLKREVNGQRPIHLAHSTSPLLLSGNPRAGSPMKASVEPFR